MTFFEKVLTKNAKSYTIDTTLETVVVLIAVIQK